MKVLVMGDTHGNWGYLNKIIEKKQPEVILQTGDFGYWENFSEYQLSMIKNGDTKIYFCDGNHENHSLLKQNGMIQEVAKNIYHCQRGSLLNLNNINILFVGGAESVDKRFRTAGFDWFPEENITQREFNIIMNHSKEDVDVVISHTCPLEFKVMENDCKGGDSNRVVLSRVLEKYSPTLWYFGHWHLYTKGQYKNTTWTCLDRDCEIDNFEILKMEEQRED